jgi:hypothetical protein
MATTTQPVNASLAYQRTPDGQERMATQSERDDVTRIIELRSPNITPSISRGYKHREGGRGAGDEVNRFLLCTLVSKSSRRIKASAQRAGESLPMMNIVRSVLRSYRLAAMDQDGPLAGLELDIAGLRVLNESVLSSEIARHCRDRVTNSNSKEQLARAERLGDRARTRAESNELEHPIELQDRRAALFSLSYSDKFPNRR